LTAGRAPDSVAIVGSQVIGGGAARGTGAASSTGGEAERSTPDMTVTWRKHRGGGEVKFARERLPLVTKRDPAAIVEAATTATFSAPGEYVVRAQVNDTSGDGGGGDQCCWTTALVKVNVK
jgi:hypothetical protein